MDAGGRSEEKKMKKFIQKDESKKKKRDDGVSLNHVQLAQGRIVKKTIDVICVYSYLNCIHSYIRFRPSIEVFIGACWMCRTKGSHWDIYTIGRRAWPIYIQRRKTVQSPGISARRFARASVRCYCLKHYLMSLYIFLYNAARIGCVERGYRKYIYIYISMPSCCCLCV